VIFRVARAAFADQLEGVGRLHGSTCRGRGPNLLEACSVPDGSIAATFSIQT